MAVSSHGKDHSDRRDQEADGGEHAGISGPPQPALLVDGEPCLAVEIVIDHWASILLPQAVHEKQAPDHAAGASQASATIGYLGVRSPDQAAIPSTSATSSAVSFQPAAFTLASTWGALVAPAMTLVTGGLCRSQLNARSRIV